MSAEKHVVLMDRQTILFGPVDEKPKAEAFLASLPAATKTRCIVHSFAPKAVDGVAAPAAVHSQPVAAAVSQPAMEQTHAQAPAKSKSSDAHSAFESFISGYESDFWKPKDGQNLIRILPKGGVLPTDWTTPYPFVVTGVHSNVGLSLSDTICCQRITFGQACPICNLVSQLYKSKDPSDVDLAKSIKGYKRIAANIIDLSDIDSGVQMWAFGKKLGAMLMSLFHDDDYKDVLDPEKGRNFKLIKQMVSGFPNYDSSRFEMNQTSLAKIYPTWEKECHDLKSIATRMTYEETSKILQQTRDALMSASGGNTTSSHQVPVSNESAGSLPVEEITMDELNRRLGV